MQEIDVLTWNRFKTYEWFKTFSNSCYSMNVRMDVTKLVEYVKHNQHSFFIDILYIILKGLNSRDEMKMRLVNDKPVIFDKINPAFTVMTKVGTFENVRQEDIDDFNTFYTTSFENIETAKNQLSIKKEDYNPPNCYNEYYITCVPWLDFTQLTHPIPDDKHSQCVPRIAIGKYVKQNDKYELTLNITVSHLFVDGYHLAMVFNNIQNNLLNCDELLKSKVLIK